MPHKVQLIFNPMANHGRSGQTASDLRAMIDEMGGADWHGTEYPAHATEVAAQAADKGYDTVVALGGDGTVHEVINGLMQIEAARRPRLGIIAIGSGNDFAHAAGVPDNPQEAVRRIFQGAPKPVDVARITDGTGRSEYFDNTAGIGFDGGVNVRTRAMRQIHGFLMYLTATLQSIAYNFTPIQMKLTYDDGAIDEPLMMVTVGNGPREGGGFITTPDSKIDDGILDFVYIGKVSQFRMLQLLPKFLAGTQATAPEVKMRRTTRLVIDADRALPIHLDGELFAPYEANVRHIEIQLFPGAIQVIV